MPFKGLQESSTVQLVKEVLILATIDHRFLQCLIDYPPHLLIRCRTARGKEIDLILESNLHEEGRFKLERLTIDLEAHITIRD